MLIGPKRDKDTVAWRQLAYILCVELTKCSIAQIGRVLGRDHTTILHGIKRIKYLREQDPAIEDIYQALTDELSSL